MYLIRAESVGTSGHHSNSVVESLDRAAGNLAFGFNPFLDLGQSQEVALPIKRAGGRLSSPQLAPPCGRTFKPPFPSFHPQILLQSPKFKELLLIGLTDDFDLIKFSAAECLQHGSRSMFDNL
jgi:hypothetical protein